MIDSHVHLITEQPQEFADALVRRMDGHGVSQAVVFGTPAPGFAQFNRTEVLRAAARHPDRFIPLDCSLDFADESSADEMIGQLEGGLWKGVGEIFLNNEGHETITWVARDGTVYEGPHFPYPAEGATNKAYAKVFQYCGERGLPVVVHCLNASVMADCLERYPGTRFIWAHADWWIDPGEVHRLLLRFGNLHCDFGVGLRAAQDEWATGTGGTIRLDRLATWREMAAAFPEKLVWGSDIFEWAHLEPQRYCSIWQTWSIFAEGVDQVTRERIGSQNIRRLLGITMTSGEGEVSRQEGA